MSNSKKKPIVKQSPRNYKKSAIYWRKIRRVIKNLMKSDKEIKNHREIINDYDYSEYKSVCTEHGYCTCERLFGRKKCIRK